MKPYQVRGYLLAVVKGQVVLLDFDGREEIEALMLWLKKNGAMSFVQYMDGITPVARILESAEPQKIEPMDVQNTVGSKYPKCSVHRVPMKPSKHTDGLFYCAHKGCKQRFNQYGEFEAK